jgi:hypothetical protein
MLEKAYKVPPPNVELSKHIFSNMENPKKMCFTKELIEEKVNPYWDEAVNSWWYNSTGFRYGRENINLNNNMIEFICNLMFSKGKDYHLLTHSNFLRIMLDNRENFKGIDDNIIIGRSQQFYASFFRELFFVKHILGKVDSIVKYYHLDLEHDADFILDSIHPIAIRHEGPTSTRYNLGKEGKSLNGLFVFMSKRNGSDGIDMLSTNEIDEYLINKDNFKNEKLLNYKEEGQCCFCKK